MHHVKKLVGTRVSQDTPTVYIVGSEGQLGRIPSIPGYTTGDVPNYTEIYSQLYIGDCGHTKLWGSAYRKSCI